MSRIKIANKMISFLEEKINCKNVMKYTDETMDSILQEANDSIIYKLTINNIPTAFKVQPYIDNLEFEEQYKQLIDVFDFMTESNHTGFEYFPYLYGVLNCHDEEKSRLYIYSELFDGDLEQLLKKIEHPSEWYDIAFQIIMINYYIEIVNSKHYHASKILYRKLEKPYYKNYELLGYQLTINHKFLIVLSDIPLFDNTDKEKSRIIDQVLTLIDVNKNEIKILPSNRVLNFLNEIKSNAENTPQILHQYFAAQPQIQP